MSRMTALLALVFLLAPAPRAWGQVDPERRRLLQLGVDKPFAGPGPVGAYLFFYSNEPHFIKPDWTLRMALAPVYINTELGIKDILPQTDLGIGVAGGGWAESYSEVRQGHYFKEESYRGDGTSAWLALYPRLNPESQRIPLNGYLSAGAYAAWYTPHSDTAANFVLPEDHVDYRFRAGLRLGGEPPRLMPGRAGELSVWYQGYFRDRHGGYGFDSDRDLEARTNLYWTRFLLSYRLESGQQFRVASIAGTSKSADRIDAYRVGGLLPFASEFPLSLPGYYNGELTAKSFVLFGGDYLYPIDELKRWSGHFFADAANVTYLHGEEQPVPWNEGLGVGLDFLSQGGILRIETNYAYGVEAIRSSGRGAHSVSLLAQLDFEAWRRRRGRKGRREHAPRAPVEKPEGLDWLYQLLRP